MDNLLNDQLTDNLCLFVSRLSSSLNRCFLCRSFLISGLILYRIDGSNFLDGDGDSSLLRLDLDNLSLNNLSQQTRLNLKHLTDFQTALFMGAVLFFNIRK